MTVRLIRDGVHGQAINTRYTGPDEDILKASGSADDRLDLATPVAAATTQQAPVSLLMATGQSGPIYGGTGAGYVTVAAATLAANVVPGGATLRFRMLLARYQPFNAGWQWRMRLAQGANAVVIAQNALGGAIGAAEVDQHIYMAPDRKAGFCYNANTLDTASLNTAGAFASTGVKGSATSNLGARTPSTQVMFVNNSAPPTVETVLIDFAQPVTVQLDLQVLNGDTAEVLGATLELLAPLATLSNFVTARATAIWGDSLVEGTGSTAVSSVPQDFPAQLRRQRAGWPIAAKGLGGQRSQGIIDRLVADAIEGKQWNAIYWIGTNDFDANIGNGPGWWNAIRTQLDRALAFRSNSLSMILNLHPRASWTVGDSNYVAMQYVNTQLAAAYGSRVCDIFTALATNAGKVPAASMFDDVHLTNAGYTTVMQAVDAKMTALGWS